MTCRNCGAKHPEGTRYCRGCGYPLLSKAEAKKGYLARTLRPVLPLTMACVAVFAGVLFLLNIFSLLYVPLTGPAGTEYASLWDVAATWHNMGKSAVWAFLGNLVFGFCNLVVSALGILYFLKKQWELPYYDRFVKKFLKVDLPAIYMGILGAAGVSLQVLFFALCSVTQYARAWSIGVPWLSWAALCVYVLIGAAGIWVFKNKD